MPKRVNYLLLDKEDITNICGIISRKDAMRELGYNHNQFENFLKYQRLFKDKYVLVEEEFKSHSHRRIRDVKKE